MHIVEELIAERMPKLVARPRLWRAVKPLVYRLLGYEAAVSLVDKIADKTGREAFAITAAHIKPDVITKGLQNLPEKGRCIIITNHPTGLADGMAVFAAIRDKRPNHLYLANADALRVIPNCRDIVIPVEWVKKKRSHSKTRQTLIDTKRALQNERCVVIFPSGRLAKLGWRSLRDQSWETSAAMLARKYKAPVIPLRIRARNSWLYYLLAALNPELRDITLFQELLNKRGYKFRLTFGEAIAPETLPKDANEATAVVRAVVEGL